MAGTVDVCLIAEGGYPYMLGGVSSWIDGLVRASPQLTFHIVAIGVSSQPRKLRYDLPANVAGVTDVILDACPTGRMPRQRDSRPIAEMLATMRTVLAGDDGTAFERLVGMLRETGFGQTALLDSKPAWAGMRAAYDALTPDGPLVDFFWAWRFLARSVLACAATRLPDAAVFHAVATGYAGLVGAYAALATGRPLALTEHGIYINERRIELSTADWLFDSGAGGYAFAGAPRQLLDVWLDAFASFSRISYRHAHAITSQYRANQAVQAADGAEPGKLLIIPNGIDAERYGAIERHPTDRPTVLMVGRIVPIKDTRTFISAVALLRKEVPDVRAVLVGPEDEDPGYAAGCRALVRQLDLEGTVDFLGKVPNVLHYLARTDVIALTSISEAQPIALLEAAAMGLPAVATDVGSCREIIEGFDGDPVRGHGGIVVPACDPQATADALATILLDHGRRAVMGEVMRRRTGSLYHRQRVRHQYEELYAGLATTAPQT